MHINMYICIEPFGNMNSDLVKSKIIHIRMTRSFLISYLSNEKRTIQGNLLKEALNFLKAIVTPPFIILV